jgi:hypothetical protein
MILSVLALDILSVVVERSIFLEAQRDTDT